MFLYVQLSYGTYFNAALPRRWNSGCDLNRLVQVPGLDQVKTRQLLLCLGERSVRHGNLAVSNPHGSRRFYGLKRFGGNELARVPQVIAAGGTLAVGHGRGARFFHVDEAEIFHVRYAYELMIGEWLISN